MKIFQRRDHPILFAGDGGYGYVFGMIVRGTSFSDVHEIHS